MIFTPRSSDTNHTCTKIQFRGYEISIAMDDNCREGSALYRSSLIVYKNDVDVTSTLHPNYANVGVDGIQYCEAEDLFKVMQAIAFATATPNAGEIVA